MSEKAKENESQPIKEYLDALSLDEPVCIEEFTNAVRGAISDRGLMVYLIWKTLEKKHPEIDAVKLLSEACWEFGRMRGLKVGEAETPDEWLKKFSIKSGLLAFDQEILELSDDKAVKIFKYCPHCEGAKRAGATPEELTILCKDILLAADSGAGVPFPHLDVRLSDKTLAEGEPCIMTVTKKGNFFSK